MGNIFVSLLVLATLVVGSLEVNACQGHKHSWGRDQGGSFFDKDQDKKVTNSEMLDGATKMFKRHDTNNDGVITLTEVKNDVNTKFKVMDKNSDGYADKSEMKKYFKEKMREYKKEKTVSN